jgi:hypothetical protein
LLLLLVLVPLAIGLELFAPEQHTAIFVASVLVILPLAAYMGRATETLAEHLGGGHRRPPECDVRQCGGAHHRRAGSCAPASPIWSRHR